MLLWRQPLYHFLELISYGRKKGFFLIFFQILEFFNPKIFPAKDLRSRFCLLVIPLLKKIKI